MKYNLGLIGYPIKHSLSPWIHEQFFRRTNIEGTYSIFEIDSHRSFSEAIKQLKSKNLHGFNVTVPYKEKILDYLDELDGQAEQIGAVNTVLCKNGKWIGYNTDGTGYVRSLLTKFPSLEKNNNLKILLLGAGGASKGIYYALIHKGFRNVSIANRSTEKAQNLLDNQTIGNVLTLNEAEKTLSEFDIIIQTTSVGMKPHEEKKIISLTNVNENVIVSDIVYQPLMTAFLQEAKSLHRSIHFGHTMLLYQAQYAFEIWTNTRPEMEKLDEQLQIILEG
ncbi:shikimate dehydrogenase [Pseudogracilibacillus sp. SE30717A]|uniref:shikimate dehydrogenase n=1 Tax=Pseudogracilibacillus sp. SE30717A TaxID=3098293 RepID=UPI00300DC343